MNKLVTGGPNKNQIKQKSVDRKDENTHHQ